MNGTHGMKQGALLLALLTGTAATASQTVAPAGLPGGGDQVQRAAAAAGPGGDILATHVCPVHGYTLRVLRPAGYPANSDARMIQVDRMNLSFHATWNEVDNLIGNYAPHELDYHLLPQNPGPDGKRYCLRTGHMIPIDTNVYQVSLAHYDDYNGTTSVFFDSNLELAPLVTLISDYNTRRDQGDALPPACNMGCLEGGGGVADDPGDGFQPGGYTTADGVQHEWDLLNPDDPDAPGTGGVVRPGAELRSERARTVQPGGTPPQPVQPRARQIQPAQ